MVKGGKSKEMKRKNQQVTSSNMVLKSLLRPARYFDGLMTNPSCYTRTKAPRRPCLICASFQHVTKHCSMSHRDKDCSDKTSSVCLRCGGLGHDMGLCKYEYTEDDLKSVQCYVCKSFGHLCCVEPCDSPPSLWAVSCYRCGQLCHTGLSCGRHYEGSPETESGFGRVKEAEKNKRRNVKAIATSEAIRKKKKQRLDEEGVAVFIDDSNEKRERETTTLSSLKKIDVTSEEKSIPHESNWTMTEKKRTKKKRKKINKNLEQHSSFHESIGKTKKNHVEPEQNFTAHESNRKRKKNKKAKGEQPPITEKPNLRSGWITEDLEEDPFHRVKVRRLSSPTTRSGHDHYILPVSPPGHNHRLHTTHFGHNYESPSLTSGGHYPGSSSTAPYDRNRINSSFESDGHLSGPPPSRLWQRNYHPTSPIAPLGHGHHRLPVTPPAHNHRSPTFSYGGHYAGSLSLVPCGDNPRYSSLESDRHVLDLPFSRLRQRYYSPTSPVAASGHCRRRLPVTPPVHNHRLPAFSSGEHHTGSLSSVPPHGGNHRDSSFEYNWHHLDSQFLRRQPYYHPTSPITPPSHNHHMLTGTYLNGNHLLPSTYKDGNHRSPTFNSGGHYSTPLSSTRYAGNHINLRFESDGHLSGPSISRWNPYYTPTSSHDQQQHHIYGHAPSRYGPAHHYDGGSIN